jgi:predicted trehalose synthase
LLSEKGEGGPRFSAAKPPARKRRGVPHLRRLGFYTAGMHMALATPCADRAFKAEELSLDDIRVAAEATRILAGRAFARVRTIAE